MKRSNGTIIIILFLGLLSCKKYEDGPCISFRKAKNKIVAEWQVESFSINNVDNTSLYQSTCNCNFKFEAKYTTGFDPNIFYFTNCKGFANEIIGDYDFADNNKILKTNPGRVKLTDEKDTSIHYIGPIGSERFTEWQIKRLTKKELWIETNYYNTDYFVKLKSD